MLLWAGVVGASEALPRSGYARESRPWLCPAEPAAPALAAPEDPVALDGLPAPEKAEEPDALLLGFESEKNRYERNLDYARTIARQDPKIVATVVKNWVSDER